MRALLALLAVVALAACGEAEDKGTPRNPPASLRVVHTFDTSEGMYIEGYAWHLEVVDDTGAQIFSEDLDVERKVVSVDAGRSYTVKSAERPCDGNCDYLDPPTGQCEVTLDVPDGEGATVRIDAAAGRACKPSVS